MNSDKGKIVALISIIVLIIVLIVGAVFIAVLDFNENNSSKKLSTTTRRTYTTTKEASTDNIDEEIDNITTDIVTTTIPVETTTTSKVPTKTTTSKKKTTTKVATSSIVVTTTTQVSIIPTPDSRETTIDSTTYPNAVDEWEWDIVDYINQERKRNGLNELEVAIDLRQLAEEGADMWLDSGDAAVKAHLKDNSNYRMHTNLAGDTSYTLYQRTVNATKVTTDPYLKYLGVGVLLKSRGLNSLPTYYYVIIYE